MTLSSCRTRNFFCIALSGYCKHGHAILSHERSGFFLFLQGQVYTGVMTEDLHKKQRSAMGEIIYENNHSRWGWGQTNMGSGWVILPTALAS